VPVAFIIPVKTSFGKRLPLVFERIGETATLSTKSTGNDGKASPPPPPPEQQLTQTPNVGDHK